MRSIVTLIIVSILLAQAEAQEISYRRITMKNKLKKFYHNGGKRYYGKLVHIYISATVFDKKPEMVKAKKGNVWLRFKNKSVPLLVSPGNLYFKRIKRKLARKNHRIKTISVYGKVIRPTWDTKGKCYIKIFKMKTFGGSLMKSVG